MWTPCGRGMSPYGHISKPNKPLVIGQSVSGPYALDRGSTFEPNCPCQPFYILTDSRIVLYCPDDFERNGCHRPAAALIDAETLY